MVPGELPGRLPIRRVMVTAVDGRMVDQPGAADLIRGWLEHQLTPYRPRAVRLTSAGLLVRYASGI
jgi:hypothetical protein